LELLEDRMLLSILYVDPSGRAPTGTFAFNTIQAAVNNAATGDTIQVDAGSYTENVLVPASKGGLTLDGAQSGVNPTQGRYGPESIIRGSVTITASNVKLDGFSVYTDQNSFGPDGGAETWSIEVGANSNPGANATNCTIKNNIAYDTVSTTIQIGARNGQQNNGSAMPLTALVLDNVIICGNNVGAPVKHMVLGIRHDKWQ
jgi:hypothetical protein